MGRASQTFTREGYAASVRQQSCRRLPRLPRTAAREAALGRVRAKKRFSLRSSPSRRYDSNACSACRLCRFLETGSLHPPLAALRRFPCAPLARALRRNETPAKGGPWLDFCVVHKLFTLPPIDNGKCRWYTAFSTQGKGVLKLRKERGVWT